MAIKVGGITVIDDSRNFQCAPTICATTCVSSPVVCTTTICATNFYGDGGNLTGTGGVTGSIIYSASDPGSGYLPADGSVYPISSYPTLGACLCNKYNLDVVTNDENLLTCMPLHQWQKYCVDGSRGQTDYSSGLKMYTAMTRVGCNGINFHGMTSCGGFCWSDDGGGGCQRTTWSAFSSECGPIFEQPGQNSTSFYVNYCNTCSFNLNNYHQMCSRLINCCGCFYVGFVGLRYNVNPGDPRPCGFNYYCFNPSLQCCQTPSPILFKCIDVGENQIVNCCYNTFFTVGTPINTGSAKFILQSAVCYCGNPICCYVKFITCNSSVNIDSTCNASSDVYNKAAFGYGSVLLAGNCCNTLLSLDGTNGCPTITPCCYTHSNCAFTAISYSPEGNVYVGVRNNNIVYSNDGITWTTVCCCTCLTCAPCTVQVIGGTPAGNVIVFSKCSGNPTMFVTCDGCTFTRHESGTWGTCQCYLDFRCIPNSSNTYYNGYVVLCSFNNGCIDFANVYHPRFNVACSGTCTGIPENYNYVYETDKWIGWRSCGGEVACWHDNRTWCCIGCLPVSSSYSQQNSCFPWYYLQGAKKFASMHTCNNTGLNITFVCYTGQNNYTCSAGCYWPVAANLKYICSSNIVTASYSSPITFTCVDTYIKDIGTNCTCWGANCLGYSRPIGLAIDADGKNMAVIKSQHLCGGGDCVCSTGMTVMASWPFFTTSGQGNTRGIPFSNNCGVTWHFCKLVSAYNDCTSPCSWPGGTCYSAYQDHAQFKTSVVWCQGGGIYNYGNRFFSYECRLITIAGDDGPPGIVNTNGYVEGCWTSLGQPVLEGVCVSCGYTNNINCTVASCNAPHYPNSYVIRNANGKPVCVDTVHGMSDERFCDSLQRCMTSPWRCCHYNRWAGWVYDYKSKTHFNLAQYVDYCIMDCRQAVSYLPKFTAMVIGATSTQVSEHAIRVKSSKYVSAGSFDFNNCVNALHYNYFTNTGFSLVSGAVRDAVINADCMYRFQSIGYNCYGQIMTAAGPVFCAGFDTATCFQTPNIPSPDGITTTYIKT